MENEINKIIERLIEDYKEEKINKKTSSQKLKKFILKISVLQK